MSLGVALAEDAADEEKVDSGTMDLITVMEGSYYNSSQSVTGTGLANIYNNLGVVDPDDRSQVLNLKTLTSGTGYYNQKSYVYVQNNSVITFGNYYSDIHNITANEEISAVYAPVSLQFPGSFKAETIRSLWRDQTYTKNYAGMISMDSLFDYAKTLQKESTIIMRAGAHNYQGYLASINSTTDSNMDINSKFDGSAHLGVTLADVGGGYINGITKDKADSTVLMDEDYRGSFNLTKKMAVVLQKTTDYGDYDRNYEGLYGVDVLDDYPWLPCLCNAGWDDMTIHDQRYHSAKNFFDCTTCLPPGPCKN